MQSIDMVVDATREFLHQIAAFLADCFLAMLVVAVGWLIAKAVRFAVERALEAVNFTVLTERAGTDNFLRQAGMRGDTTTLFGLGRLLAGHFGGPDHRLQWLGPDLHYRSSGSRCVCSRPNC